MSVFELFILLTEAEQLWWNLKSRQDVSKFAVKMHAEFTGDFL